MKFKLLFSIIVLFIGLVGVAYADTGTSPTPVTINLPDPLGGGSLIDIINNILGKLVFYAAPVVAIMVLWGGFQILTAAGQPEKVKTGGKTILYAAIGYLVLLLSTGVAAILKEIFTVTPP